jgi:putative transposase
VRLPRPTHPKLKGPAKWTYYYLYVILDIFSRYVVGGMIAAQESATLAKRLITAACAKQQIVEDQLTLHADRGSSMTSKVVAQLRADLGVTKTHSRPPVSNDNPFSESQFKTMKYRPEFPQRFGSLQDARAFGRVFFPWYNHEHRHSGLALYTPADVHFGRVEQIRRNHRKPWTPPIDGIPIASHTNHPRRPCHRTPSGSIHRKTRKSKP